MNGKLRAYLKQLDSEQKKKFAQGCGTTANYLLKAIFAKPKFDVPLCINIERESAGAVRCEDLRSDVDWEYLRGSSAPAAPPPRGSEVQGEATC